MANFDTEPQAAEIICDGKSLGLTPLKSEDYRAMIISDEQMKELKEKQGGILYLNACKARWMSGYEDYFPIQVNIKDYAFINEIRLSGDKTLRNYLITKTLKRNKDKDYEFDVLVEQRFRKMGNALRNVKGLNLKTNPAGAQIQCESLNRDFNEVLKTGIFEIPQCKAQWVSGYEMAFRHRINIDKEDPSVLLNQTLNRPNTAGYADDMRWALELEKKQILEANERARTQAAQAQAAAQQRAAAAAAAQAQAAAAAAQAAQQQAQSLQGINRSLKNMDDKSNGIYLPYYQ